MFQLHELLKVFGSLHGQMLNKCAVARTLATTRLQVRRFLYGLEDEGYLRLLLALPPPCPSDIICKPILYLRAKGWNEAFVKVEHPGACLRVPVQGELAARITDGIIEREREQAGQSSRFYAMGRYRRRGVDLVVCRASGWRIGFCFEPRATDPQTVPAINALREAKAKGWIDAAILVSCESPLAVAGGVVSLPAPYLLAMYSEWTDEKADLRDMQDILSWIDEQYQIAGLVFTSPYEPMGLDCQYAPLDAEWLKPLWPRAP